jgi:hypothetical protein
MGLPKNRTNNPHGRKKGSPNKITKAIRPMIKDIVENELIDFQKVLGELDPKDRANLILKLIEFIIPRANENTESTELKPQDQDSFYIKSITDQIIKVEEDIKWRIEQEQKILNQSKSLPPSPKDA